MTEQEQALGVLQASLAGGGVIDGQGQLFPAQPGDMKEAIELAKLRRENARLQDRLERAEFIIDFQKKVAQMFGKTLETPDLDDPS